MPVTEIVNAARRRMQAGEVALGFSLRQSRTVDIARVARSCDFDWLFIDMEHNSMSLDTAAQISMAALDAGVAPIVRVPGHEHYHASRALDSGALGIIFPHVSTPAEARHAAQICRFPPAGRRSIPAGQPQLSFAAMPTADAARLVNDAVLVVAMLETPEAIANADEIAATPGVDVLLMGTNDLCAELGIHGQFTHPKIREAYGALIAAARKHGKFPGMGGIYDEPIMRQYIEMGCLFVQGGSDLSFLLAAGRARSAFVRSLRAGAG